MLRSLTSALLLLCFCMLPSLAQVKVNALIAPGMVIQREQKVKIWGTAQPNEKINIRFRDELYPTKAGADGKWMALINSGLAGGPYRMVISGTLAVLTLPPTKIDIDPVYVGEVWLAGGQSNMEYPMKELGLIASLDIKQANDPAIRMVKINYNPATLPTDSLSHSGWQGVDSNTVRNMSAVAYHYARRMRKQLGIPVGIISCNWGGTPAETWVSAVGLRNYPEFAESISKMKAQPISYSELEQAMVAESSRKVKARMQDLAYLDSLHIYMNADWKKNKPATKEKVIDMKLPGNWEQKGFGEFDGIGYLFTKVAIPATMKRNGVTISLGAIDDSDSTWVNGEFVGATSGYTKMRKYAVPASCFTNTDSIYIIIKVLDTGGGGGISGHAKDLAISDGTTQVLLPDWKGIKALDWSKAQMPKMYTPSSTPTLPSVLYNGMIHPLKNYSIRGVLLYHGTANAYRAAQYHTLFPDWISDWRNHFGDQNLPFIYVQLAGFMAPNADCNVPSAWAELREAQRLTLQKQFNTAMVVAYDLGDANDIHPKRKMEVGERVWIAASDLLYHNASTPTGIVPEYVSMHVSGSYAIVKLTTTKGLHQVREPRIGGFCIAGADKKWHEAEVQIKDDILFVSSPAVAKPVAVRYGWSNNPTNANLFTEYNLPISPFRTDNWPLSTEGSK